MLVTRRKKGCDGMGAKLYESLGFVIIGGSIHMIQGKRIEFTDMAMTKEKFNNLNAEENS